MEALFCRQTLIGAAKLRPCIPAPAAGTRTSSRDPPHPTPVNASIHLTPALTRLTLQELCEYRRLGLRTIEEAEVYESDQKRRWVVVAVGVVGEAEVYGSKVQRRWVALRVGVAGKAQVSESDMRAQVGPCGFQLRAVVVVVVAACSGLQPV